VQRWRRNSILGLIVILGAVVVWGTQSWDDHQHLKTPIDVEPASVTYRCPAPFAGAGPGHRTGERPAYPLTREPCGTHHERQLVAMFDLVVGGAALVGLLLMGRGRADPVEA
jgi:hypothetical protein